MALRLILHHGDQKLAVDVQEGTYVIGRDERAEIVVPSSTVSARHAELTIGRNAATIRDLGSSNGTFVNGVRIAAAEQVRPSDEVVLGTARLTIASAGGQDAGPDPDPTGRYPSLRASDLEKAPRVSWTARLWLAGATAILVLIFLLLVTEAYAQRQAGRAQLAARYMGLAAQYMHVLRQSQQGAVPAPAYDHWLAAPVLVLNREGQVLYPMAPQPAEEPRRSPLAIEGSGTIADAAKVGLYRIPGTSDPVQNSAPVIVNGELFGFVIAGEGKQKSNLPLIALIIFCASAIAMLLLYVLIRPVTLAIRGDVELLTAKLGPLAHGIIDSLPRAHRMPELDALAVEVETLVRTRNVTQSQSDQARKATDHAYSAHFPALVDAARLPYCFISNDFHLLASNRALATLQEFADTRRGVSVFDSGMTNVQSKQLIRAINDARTSGEAYATVSFSVVGESHPCVVTVRKFTETGGAHIFGLLFTAPPR